MSFPVAAVQPAKKQLGYWVGDWFPNVQMKIAFYSEHTVVLSISKVLLSTIYQNMFLRGGPRLSRGK